jgi:carbonic anhydrase/acetyltransferase-like protein (isoleucine patch superfamily)
MIREFIGKAPQVDDSNFIAENATVIGDVTLGEGASIWYQCTVRGDVNWIRIGATPRPKSGRCISWGEEEACVRGRPCPDAGATGGSVTCEHLQERSPRLPKHDER